jgi:hypothetical protein
MSSVIALKTVKQGALSNLQKTFNRLKKKIGVLQNQLKTTETTLEEALGFFQKEILPVRATLLNIISELIKILYRYHKDSKRLTKTKRMNLKELIVSKCYDTLALATSSTQVDTEVQQILKELDGVDSHDVFKEDIEDGKNMLSEIFKDLNLDVNLSSLDASDDQASLMQKIMAAMFEAHQKQQAEFPSAAKPKSKKELQKEMKAKELEKLQLQGLGTIYKQLAKALHPDLEQDPVVRSEKEELMKRLTTAYKNEDLHALLSIEMEWLNHTESGESEGKLQSDEQLKIFNSVLKDQIAELEARLAMIPIHPRFITLNCMDVKDATKILPQLIARRYELEIEARDFEEIIGRLSSPGGESFLINILQA